MHMDKIRTPQNESFGNLTSRAVPENLLPCTSKASITVFDATSQRISILFSVLWHGIFFTARVVAMCKLLCRNKGDASDRQHDFSYHSALHQVLHSPNRISHYLVFEICSASSSCQIDWFFSKTKELWKLVTSSYIVWHSFVWFFSSSHKGKS